MTTAAEKSLKRCQECSAIPETCIVKERLVNREKPMGQIAYVNCTGEKDLEE